MRPLAMNVPELGWGSSIPIDLFTAFAVTSQRGGRGSVNKGGDKEVRWQHGGEWVVTRGKLWVVIYLEYEAAKERRLWDDVRSRRSPTHYDKADFNSSYRNKSKKDSDFDMILDDLFRIRADNLKRMGQDIVQDSICKQDVDLDEDQEEDGDDRDTFDMWDIMIGDVERIRHFLTLNVPEVIEDVIQPLIPKTLHTTPPNEDYVAPDTKSILDKLLEEFRDEILNITMGYNSEETKFKVTSTRNYVVDAHGVVLGSFFATGRHFKFRLVRYHAEDDDVIFVIMDVARRSRLGAWLRACCFFIIPRKSRGVFRSNSTLIS
ncbi:hypothetical protein Tco_0736211 [Tanacetum coccineum]